MSSSTPTRKYSAGAGPRPGFHRQVQLIIIVIIRIILIIMIMIINDNLNYFDLINLDYILGHCLPSWLWRTCGDGTQVLT